LLNSSNNEAHYTTYNVTHPSAASFILLPFSVLKMQQTTFFPQQERPHFMGKQNDKKNVSITNGMMKHSDPNVVTTAQI
jgi:hypothetical protein